MRIFLLASLVSLSLCSQAFAAKGVPVGGVDDGTGVVAAGGGYRYVTHWTAGTTSLTKSRVRDGRMLAELRLRRHVSVPLVAYDGSTSGLSADGRRLVLIKPRTRFPAPRTELIVVDARRLAVERRIHLAGDFGFDAISPDGSTLYLVNYLGGNEIRYAVRAFDVRTGHLAGGPIVDPRNPGEKMVGLPVTRAVSPDGRWAYTLYDDSGGSHPFVHALDTTGRTAFCIDLDSLEGRGDLMALRLRMGGGGRSLTVVHRDESLAVIDTRTFAVGPPGALPAPAKAPREAAGGTARWPWFAAAGAALLLLLATHRFFRSGRIPGTPHPARPDESRRRV
jgi:DNA-binding beta-propeller fold protein YncE